MDQYFAILYMCAIQCHESHCLFLVPQELFLLYNGYLNLSQIKLNKIKHLVPL